MSVAPPVLAWVALGSNLGDRREHLSRAVHELAATEGIRVRRLSPWFETEPVGGPAGQGRYWNGVCELETTLAPRSLLERLLAIEARLGRVRTERNGPRTIDLDLLLYGDVGLDEPDLVVPHPRMEERIFVLEPLSHLIPERRLSRSGCTVRERLSALRGGA